ncbi:uncharacterized protein CLUP02_02623 [Colletotrichum lupini]|uniref:Uncharacterized protein n=1 Tax=Colletotrichum lupini TaxID=145971 RepID=A0A9Q8SHS2_9PEZI|nr:uncharacterized protein CLUP02_02623 [Colletotrichum lupini]UQC77156.1 hypothetical protein CLUP02_02623 [Colletotrichum lupini]
MRVEDESKVLSEQGHKRRGQRGDDRFYINIQEKKLVEVLALRLASLDVTHHRDKSRAGDTPASSTDSVLLLVLGAGMVRLPWGRMVLLELGGSPGARRCPLDAGQASRRMQPLSPYGCLRQGGTDERRSGPYMLFDERRQLLPVRLYGTNEDSMRSKDLTEPQMLVMYLGCWTSSGRLRARVNISYNDEESVSLKARPCAAALRPDVRSRIISVHYVCCVDDGNSLAAVVSILGVGCYLPPPVPATSNFRRQGISSGPGVGWSMMSVHEHLFFSLCNTQKVRIWARPELNARLFRFPRIEAGSSIEAIGDCTLPNHDEDLQLNYRDLPWAIILVVIGGRWSLIVERQGRTEWCQELHLYLYR